MTRCVKQWKISGASDAFTDKIILRIKSREQLQLHGAQQQAKELMMVIARGCPEWRYPRQWTVTRSGPSTRTKCAR
jgi:hypothetical protein